MKSLKKSVDVGAEMLKKLYRVCDAQNRIINCIDRENVEAILREIKEKSIYEFERTEVYDPEGGWTFAKSWIRSKSSKYEVN